MESLTLVYGENGKGKTTLTAILRSLATGDPAPITSRARVGATAPPRVIVSLKSGTTPRFENGSWTLPGPTLHVFDDAFVDDNVCSGLRVLPEHRQNLHEVIIGSAGVALAREVIRLTSEIADAHTAIQTASAEIPVEARFGFRVEDLVALPVIENVDDVVLELTRRVDALRRADELARAPEPKAIELPSVDVTALAALLGRDIEDLETSSVKAVQEHTARLGGHAEQWISEGLGYVDGPKSPARADCPFCLQSLADAPIIDHYRAYFSASYRKLQQDLARTEQDHVRAMDDAALARSERALADLARTLEFWSRLVPVPALTIDAAALAGPWTRAHAVVMRLLEAKRRAPLEVVRIDDDAAGAIAELNAVGKTAATFNDALVDVSARIRARKTEAQAGGLAAAEQELRRARASQARHSDALREKCDEYKRRVDRKADLEREKETAREALDRHRDDVMPRYQKRINHYLERFNAGFRIVELAAENPRGRPSSSYAVEIWNARGPLTPADGAPVPSFATSLSSGDRNSLALAFFLSGLDLEPEQDLAQSVVLIDDPGSSLDESRTTVTTQEIRRLRSRAAQVIVLSHSLRLLGEIWAEERRAPCATLLVRQDGDASTLMTMNMAERLEEEYDARHRRLREFAAGDAHDVRQVALDLRPVLEGFLRKACVAHFDPGERLTKLLGRCRDAAARGASILPDADVRELTELDEYASRFHHDDDAVRFRALAEINEGALRGFAKRVVDFTTARGKSASQIERS